MLKEKPAEKQKKAPNDIMKNKNFIKSLSFLLILIIALFYYQISNTLAKEPVRTRTGKSTTPVKNDESIAVGQIASAILTKMHYQKKPISKENSVKFFYEYLEKIDPLHMFFTQEKIREWKPQIPMLIQKLLAGKPDFAYQVYDHYLVQLKKYKQFVIDFKVTDQQLNQDETIEIDRTKAAWPKNEYEMQEIWRKKLTNDVILLSIFERIEKEKAVQKSNKQKTKWKQATPLEQVKKRALLYIAEEFQIEELNLLDSFTPYDLELLVFRSNQLEEIIRGILTEHQIKINEYESLEAFLTVNGGGK